MHRPQTWLLALLSLSSCVSAFYPYSAKTSTSEHRRRFYPIQQDVQQPKDALLKIDVHKIRRQTGQNQFSVQTSNPPTGGPNALAISQDGSDYSYFSSMKFGSKGQEMYMLIDTGSANTWVFSSDCKAATCSIHNTFGTEDSTTLKTTTNTWDLAYGTGAVAGIVASDTVAFANFSLNMGFGLATNASNDFNNYPMDGILGLGRTSSDQLGTPTIIQVLDDQAKLSQNIIGVHLHRAADGTKDGEIVFGGVDTGKFQGNLAYTKTANDGAWEIPIEDFVLAGMPCNFTDRTAIIDTGTTFILMPPADAKILHGLIPGSSASGEGFTVPCNANIKVEVRINGKFYNISPRDYVGKPSSGSTTTCGSNIIGHQAFGDKQWILGDVFLKNVYAAFDFDNNQIGFALPGSGGSAAAASSANSSGAASGTALSSASSTATAPASSSSSASANSNNARPSSAGTSDSNIGAETSTGAAAKNLMDYWRVGFSIAMAFRGAVHLV